MTTRKLNGPYGGDYITDGEGNSVVWATNPVTNDNDLGGRLTSAEKTSRKVLGGALPAALSEGSASLALQVLGDSTGNDTTEWVHLLAQDIAVDYPSHEVRHYIWNAGTELMPKNPTVVQAAPNSNRRCVWTGTQASRQFTGAALTGDLDIRIKCQMSNWADGAAAFIVGHFGAGGSRGWRLYKTTGGFLSFDWSTDGTNIQTVVSSGSWAMPSTPIWIRVTLDVDNDDSGHDIAFYTSTDGVSYTQIGSTTTRESTTSMYDVTGHPFEVGARAQTTEPFNGSVYEIHLLNAIDGYFYAPALPEHWVGAASTSPEPVGDPIVTFVNGSHSGAALSYLDGGTVLERMTPNYGQITAIISDGHNEAQRQGAVLFASMSTYVSSIRARLPSVPIIALTQNPKISPALMPQSQAVRRLNYMSWETELDWDVIDTYGAFLSDGRALDVLINDADGLHPTADGSRVWADAVKAALGLT